MEKMSYFRSNIVRRAAKSFGSFVAQNALLTHTKISDLNMTVLIQQNVIKF